MGNDFSSRLRTERISRGLTQEQFAELGGVKRVSQHLYEQGSRSPDVNYLLRLASHGVQIGQLLGLGAKLDQVAVSADVAVEAYATVDSFAKDDAGQSLPLEDRIRLFRSLLAAMSRIEAAANPVEESSSAHSTKSSWPPPGSIHHVK